MRVIDRTPLQDLQGNISFISRIQGTIKYGASWFSELEAQKVIIAQLDRLLDKGFVLIRNFTLPGSAIVIPIILIGNGSLSVIFATPLKGQFEAKGNEWNTIGSNGSTPANRNLVDILSRLSRAFQKYLQVKNVNTPLQVEAVLIASDPGAAIESIRPAVRVIRSDAVKQFAHSLNQASPLLRTDQVIALAEKILNPEEAAAKPAIAALEEENGDMRSQSAVFIEDTPKAPSPTSRPKPAVSTHAKKSVPPNKKTLSLTRNQIILLVGMGLIAFCVVIAAAITVFQVLGS